MQHLSVGPFFFYILVYHQQSFDTNLTSCEYSVLIPAPLNKSDAYVSVSANVAGRRHNFISPATGSRSPTEVVNPSWQACRHLLSVSYNLLQPDKCDQCLLVLHPPPQRSFAVDSFINVKLILLGLKKQNRKPKLGQRKSFDNVSVGWKQLPVY